MNKELIKYKEQLIKNGFMVLDETGKIKDLATKSEVIESIKKEELIIESIERQITDGNKGLKGKIRLVKPLNSLVEKTLLNLDIVQLEINEENIKIQEYIKLNDFVSELQNRGFTLGLTSQEEVQEESKIDKLVNKVNKTRTLTGYKIVIVPKDRVLEDSSRNR
ncbi:MAG: hypothetical protein IJL74_04370 [Bacilli bacterium]|nr:hypothetical protein [Bacilli bacterium]